MVENLLQYEKRQKDRSILDHELVMHIYEDCNKITLYVKSNNTGRNFNYMTRYLQRVLKDLEKEILAKTLELEKKEFQNIHNAAKMEALEFLAAEIAIDCTFTNEVD